MFTSLRKRPDNITDEQLIQKFKLMMHFQGSGTSTDKDYKDFHDVCDLNHNFQKPRYHQVEIQKITETKNYFKIILTQSLSYFLAQIC